MQTPYEWTGWPKKTLVCLHSYHRDLKLSYRFLQSGLVWQGTSQLRCPDTEIQASFISSLQRRRGQELRF